MRPLPLKFQLRRRAAPPIALIQIWVGLPAQIQSAPHPPPTCQAEAQGEGLLPRRESSPLQEEIGSVFPFGGIVFPVVGATTSGGGFLFPAAVGDG